MKKTVVVAAAANGDVLIESISKSPYFFPVTAAPAAVFCVYVLETVSTSPGHHRQADLLMAA